MNKLLCTTGVVLLLGSSAAIAAELSAKQIMQKAYNYLHSQDKYAFDAVISDVYHDKEDVVKTKHNVSVELERPDKLRVDVNGDTRHRSTYINHGTFTMLDHSFGYYGQLKVPETIDGALDYIINRYGINAPLTALLYSDMSKRAHFTSSKNFGVVDVAGTECNYIAFKNANREVHVWVSTGDKPLVKNFSVIETSKTEQFRINTTIVWKDASTVKESDFVFTAPKDVMKISVEPAN